jgi:hypothetical protein
MIIKKIFYHTYEFLCCKRKKQNNESNAESFDLPFPPRSSHELTTYYVLSNEEDNPLTPNYPINIPFIQSNFPSLLNPIIYPTNNQIDFISDTNIDTYTNYSPTSNINSTNSTNSNKKLISDDEMLELLDHLKHQNDDLVKLINENFQLKKL